MRQKTCYILLLFGFLIFPVKARQIKSDFKVVGYYSLRSAMGDNNKFPFNKVTHVNLWFLNPDTLGNFTRDFSALKPFISKAHRNNVKVLFSIAGGSEQPYYHRLLRDDSRAGFIQKLVSEVLKYNIDGIDVDLEGSDIPENYEDFIVELARALRLHNKLITAAIQVFFKDHYTDKALTQFDFVNIMAYDHTGPWRPEIPGQHSSYAHAEEDLEYFGVEKKIPGEKLVLGVPFYGHAFDQNFILPATSLDYKEIISGYPGSESNDQLTMPDGRILYYNGIPTIKLKTLLAQEKASGIMIWQLEGDARGSRSLLKAIHKAIYSKK